MEFKLALRTYINQLQHTLSLSRFDIGLISVAAGISGSLSSKANISTVVNWLDFDAVTFLALNSLRDIREFVYASSDFQTEIAFHDTFDQLFFWLMIAGILITVISITTVIYQLGRIERIKGDIMRVFSSI